MSIWFFASCSQGVSSKDWCHHEEPDQRKLILLYSANPFQHSGLDASRTPVESQWDQFCPVPQTEPVRTSCPPHPLYAELHLCFVFSVFFSISTFQWAYYLNEQYQSVLVMSRSSSLYFLASSEHWGACRCHKNVLSRSSMDLVHNDFCNEQMAPGLVGRILKLHHSFPPWRFQS